MNRITAWPSSLLIVQMALYLTSCRTARPLIDSPGEPFPDTASGSELELADEPDRAAKSLEEDEHTLNLLRMSRLDVNEVDLSAVLGIPGIDLADALVFLSYRSVRGRIDSVSELDDLDELSDGARRLFSGVLSVETEKEPEASGRRLRIRLRTAAHRAWENEGRGDSGKGTPYRRTIRLLAGTERVQAALTLRNDPGEPFRWRPRDGWFGFDHLAGFVRWASPGLPVEVLAGDFKVDTGQGIVHSRPFGTRIQSNAPWRAVSSARSGLSGYAGSSGPAPFRGLGVSARLRRSFRVTLYASRRHLDAVPFALPNRIPSTVLNIEPDVDNPDSVDPGMTDPFVLVDSDEHITDAQIARRKTLRTVAAGGSATWSHGRFRVGLQYTWTRMQAPVAVSSSIVARRFTNGSLFASYSDSNWRMAIEAAVNGLNRARAVFLGLEYRPVRSSHYFFSIWHYPRSWVSRYGAPFGYRSRFGRQTTVLIGAGRPIHENLTTAASMEVFLGEDDRRFRISSSRFRFVVEYETDAENRHMLSLQSTITEQPHEWASEIGTVRIGLKSSWLGRASWRFDKRVSERIRWRLRIDVSASEGNQPGQASGIHVGQTLVAEIAPGVRIGGQVSVVDAPSYETRFFVHEPDVSGTIVAPALQGTGQKLVAVVTLEPVSSVLIELKAARAGTFRTMDDLSTGAAESPGLRTTLAFQVTTDLNRP